MPRPNIHRLGMPKQRVCPHMAPFDRLADPNGISPAAVDAVGVGRREAFGVRQLAAALPYAQTTCLSPYPIFPISPITGHATLFDPANRATEHTPAWVRRRIAALPPAR